MDFEFSSGQREIREAVTSLCARFGDDYWRECDERSAYPEEFVRTLSEAGWLAALIPQEYGGAGLTMLDGSIILEEINHSGGNAAACHAQMYTMAVAAQARERGTEAPLSAAYRFGRTAAAGLRRDGTRRRLGNAQGSKPSPGAQATTM